MLATSATLVFAKMPLVTIATVARTLSVRMASTKKLRVLMTIQLMIVSLAELARSALPQKHPQPVLTATIARQ